MRKLYDAVRSLIDMPNRGRVGRVEGTRGLFFLLMPYVAVYRVEEENIEILRFYHTSQNR